MTTNKKTCVQCANFNARTNVCWSEWNTLKDPWTGELNFLVVKAETKACNFFERREDNHAV